MSDIFTKSSFPSPHASHTPHRLRVVRDPSLEAKSREKPLENFAAMSPPMKPERVAEIMVSWLGLEVVSFTELQTLWAGYGHICAIEARKTSNAVAPDAHCDVDASPDGIYRLILKVISPLGKQQDEGHLRKMFSYEVEQHFYDQVAPHLGDDIAVAKCLASTRSMKKQATTDGIQDLIAIVMTDLRPAFPIAGEKRAVLEPPQARAAIQWLAKFHSSSWSSLPAGLGDYLLPPLQEEERRRSRRAGSRLWLNGGYTYLATRRKEYASLADEESSEWAESFCSPMSSGSSFSTAEAVADVLTPTGRGVETYIHGDVKSENLFSSTDGQHVAFFDFQYVGIGLGVADLAKLFTCSVPLHMLVDSETVPDELPMGNGEKGLLCEYREALLRGKPVLKKLDYDWDLFARHWECALVDWCRFGASWGFWGNYLWLQARVRFILRDKSWRVWLQKQ